jgi:ubiquinone/menaquinone biosynthesis C-methylase UbiE
MILEELQHLKPENGVLKLSEPDKSFERAYHKILKSEERLYSDEEVKLLPFASKKNPHKSEWDIRANSFLRLKEYLSKKKSDLNILDVGGGNGWLCSQILREQKHNFYCVDVNLHKLEQGARLFLSNNLKFIYADLFQVKFPRSSFDIIILNSSLQYFSDLRALMRELFYLLKSYGEVHIIDTKIYEEDEVEAEKNKLFRYFELVGVPQMKEKYSFHTYKSFNGFNHKFLFDPRNFSNKIINIAFGKDSSYPWIKVSK